MLTSIVLRLKSRSNSTLPSHLGRANYAETLRHLGQIEPALQEWVHAMPGVKPLTCSSIYGNFARRGSRIHIPQGQEIWLRATGLNERVSSGLGQAFSSKQITCWHLANHSFDVVDICKTQESHPWAGQSCYSRIGRANVPSSTAGPGPLRLHFRLLSPTSFKSNEMQVPLPLPDLFFQSLRNRWNAFSSKPIPDELNNFVNQHVAIGKFELKSVIIPQKNGGARTGSVGEISYVVRNKDRYWTSILRQLAEFAFYCGVGVQTTSGMGQVSRGIH